MRNLVTIINFLILIILILSIPLSCSDQQNSQTVSMLNYEAKIDSSNNAMLLRFQKADSTWGDYISMPISIQSSTNGSIIIKTKDGKIIEGAYITMPSGLDTAIVEVYWSFSTDSTEVVKGYKVYYGFDYLQKYVNVIDVGYITKCKVTVIAGMLYRFTVTAYNAKGESGYSDTVVFTAK